jgi:hypothetical protein
MVKREKESDLKESSSRRDEWLDRRKFLMKAGKYSAAAAGLMAGSSTFFSACFEDEDDDEGRIVPNGTGEIAKSAYMDESQSAALASGDLRYYRFAVESAGNYTLAVSESSVGADSVHLGLRDPTGELIWSDDAFPGATWNFALTAGTYYLRIESDTDGVILVFSIVPLGGGEEESEEEWSDYSDWTDAAEWVDNTWSNNTWSNTWSDSSGWKDASTGTWVAHADTWYNGEIY